LISSSEAYHSFISSPVYVCMTMRRMHASSPASSQCFICCFISVLHLLSCRASCPDLPRRACSPLYTDTCLVKPDARKACLMQPQPTHVSCAIEARCWYHQGHHQVPVQVSRISARLTNSKQTPLKKSDYEARGTRRNACTAVTRCCPE